MRAKKIDLIEELLSEVLPLLSEEDYLKLIQGNGVLCLYDDIAGKVENKEWPVDRLNEISEKDLDIIIAYLKEATRM